MQKLVVLLAVTAFVVAGCYHDHGRHHGKGAPPGQVQKATGYNPASGKVKKK